VKTFPLKLRQRLSLSALAVIVLVSASAGCARSPVEKAMAGKYEEETGNKIITSYCTSCHSHKDFKAPPHLEVVSTLYEDKPYRGATECGVCHRVNLKGWAIPWVKRSTRRPHGTMTPMAKRAKPPEPPTLQ
jgi:hypothetical protein